MARRRTIFRVVALLLAWGAAGATLNVAVAWGCALWSPAEKRSHRTYGEPTEIPFEIQRRMPPHWLTWPTEVDGWYRRVDRTQARSLGLELESLTSTKELAHVWLGGPDHDLTTIRCGWPSRSFIAEGIIDRDANRQIVVRWDGAIIPPSPFAPKSIALNLYSLSIARPLPNRMLWPGFAINTLFYAGVL